MTRCSDEYLLQVVFFVEHLNWRVARRIVRDSSVNFKFQDTVLEVRKFLRINNFNEWPRGSEFVGLCLQAGIGVGLRPDLDVIEELVHLLLQPSKLLMAEKGEDLEIRGRSPFLDAVGQLDELSEEIWEVESRFGNSLIGVDWPLVRARWGKIKVHYWDCLLDPVSVLQSYLLSSGQAETLERANHVIQRWLRREFALTYDPLLKYGIPRLAHCINELFLGHKSPSLADHHQQRSTTVGFSFLVDLIFSNLKVGEDGVVGFSNDPAEASVSADTDQDSSGEFRKRLRVSLGVYFGLRLMRVLRARFQWVYSAAGSPVADRQEHRSPKLCLSALRAVDSTYFWRRVFGVISGIEGLNFIFQGGLLPRTGSGRTIVVSGPPGVGKTVFSLQMLADIARMGGLGFYLSFEESYELILDRLVSFGFLDRSRFELCYEDYQDLRNLTEVMRGVATEERGRGVLCLYGAGDGEEERDLLAMLERLSRRCEGGWKWRAVLLDSVDALEFGRGGGDFTRQVLHSLVEKIETGGFLGLLVGEKGGGAERDLEFLADTVMELGFEGPDRARWLEILKCRSQPYHAGQHPARIQSRGFRIYPSLAAIRSSLRRRARSTLSEQRSIRLPRAGVPGDDLGLTRGKTEPQQKGTDECSSGALDVVCDASAEEGGGVGRVEGIAEKSTTLLHGSANVGKSDFALRLALGEIEDSHGAVMGRPESVLVITFRTTERHFHQGMRAHVDLQRVWNGLKYKKVRWYSPGTNISGSHLLADIRGVIKDCRWHGIGLDRIVIDELEAAEHTLPHLAKDQLFWSTLVQLVGTEAMTGVFVFGELDRRGDAFYSVGLEADYIFRLERSEEGQESLAVFVEKMPDLAVAGLRAARRTEGRQLRFGGR